MFLALPLLLTFQSPTYGLPADPALDRPLAIEARIEPLPELLSRVGKSLGTPLTVERRMEGLKATVFTPARPARLPLATLSAGTRERIREVMLEAILESNGELVVPHPPGENASEAEFALRCAIVGVRPGPGLSIRFEEGADEIFRAPWIMLAPNTPPGRRGAAVWVGDEHGAGLRFFIPKLEAK